MQFWLLPLAATLLVAAWQWATVTANYGGNWTALFCTGAEQRLPPLVAAEHVYVFPNSGGYDGQFYHYIAHDPWLRSGLQSYMDAPGLRYRRILVPLLAYGIAMGRGQWVDRAYELVFLAGIGLGVYWSCGLAQQAGLAAAWGLLFLLMPAVPISMDRLVVDGALAALTAGFLYYSRSPSWKLFLVLACAALTRESGVLLPASYCAYLLLRREFRKAGVFALSGLPAAAWYLYVHAHTAPGEIAMSWIPLLEILRALGHPERYPARIPFAAAVHAADYAALAGVLAAFGLAFVWFFRGPSGPARLTAALFAAAALFQRWPGHWENVYHFGRVATPLLLCLGAMAAQQRKAWLLAPAAMMLPKIAMQLAPQALGVMRWLG